MNDLMGKYKIELSNCEQTADGIAATGDNPSVTISLINYQEIDSPILCNGKDFFAISFSGSFPTIKQQEFNGDLVTRTIYSISHAGKYISTKIQPLIDSDNYKIDNKSAFSLDEDTDVHNLMFYATEYYDSSLKKNIITPYVIYYGIATRLTSKKVVKPIKGIVANKIIIELKNDTIIKGIVRGNKEFQIVEVSDALGNRGNEPYSPTKDVEVKENRESIEGFLSKINKLFPIQG